ncbi:MAG: DUF2784 domain-containing protein [Pirellulales bacterium]|nr:DUF2784 domain-containing protein [Pirellulales bacterium]
MSVVNVYSFLADAVVLAHLAYVAFVVGGLGAILLGICLRWRWVKNYWFRIVHLLMIAVVVAESLCGVICPMTDWESILREKAGHPIEQSGFVARWAHDLLFVDLTPEQMTIYYVLFGVAVLLTFVLAPPRRPWRKRP